MATLLQDISAASAWIVRAFGADDLILDYTIESFKEIDKFFDIHARDGEAVPGGRLSQGTGYILFALGSYVGETFIKVAPGSVWKVDDNDPQGEVTAEIILPPDGFACWPMMRISKRFRLGEEEGIYAYGLVMLKIAAGGYPGNASE
jgi:hypothetical protein